MDAQSLSNLRKNDMPASFLSLAPASSRTGRIVPAPAQRPTVSRASSLSSEGSNSSFRILKLAPVQQGEHIDSHKGDWYDFSMDQGLTSLSLNDRPSFLPLAPTGSPACRIAPAERQPVSRSSSLSSEGSATSFRVLKLAPVQQGEHVDSHKLDWHDVVVFE